MYLYVHVLSVEANRTVATSGQVQACDKHSLNQWALAATAHRIESKRRRLSQSGDLDLMRSLC